jgi:hypothetical protein
MIHRFLAGPLKGRRSERSFSVTGSYTGHWSARDVTASDCDRHPEASLCYALRAQVCPVPRRQWAFRPITEPYDDGVK